MKVYLAMQECLRAQGIDKSVKEIKYKIENLANRYRNFSRKTTGQGPVTWRFYAEIAKFLSCLPINNGSLIEKTTCEDTTVEMLIHSMEHGQPEQEEPPNEHTEAQPPYEVVRRREAKAENELYGLTTEDKGRPNQRVRRSPRPLDRYSSGNDSSEENEQEALQDSALNEFMSGTPTSTTSGRIEESFVLTQPSCQVEVGPAPRYSSGTQLSGYTVEKVIAENTSDAAAGKRRGNARKALRDLFAEMARLGQRSKCPSSS
ncbi:hypothetical protein MTO96_006647 [Rhipicephalus appendiculatus]